MNYDKTRLQIQFSRQQRAIDIFSGPQMTSRFADMWQKVRKSLNWQGRGADGSHRCSSHRDCATSESFCTHVIDVVSPFWWLSPWLFSKALYLPRPRLSAIVPNWLFIGPLILANCPLQVLHNKCQLDEYFLPQLLSELVRLSWLSPKWRNLTFSRHLSCPSVLKSKCPKLPIVLIYLEDLASGKRIWSPSVQNKHSLALTGSWRSSLIQ